MRSWDCCGGPHHNTISVAPFSSLAMKNLKKKHIYVFGHTDFSYLNSRNITEQNLIRCEDFEFEDITDRAHCKKATQNSDPSLFCNV